MVEILEQKPSCKSEFPAESKKDFMLATIRAARARAQALAFQLDEIGISLRYNMIDAEGAVSWLDFIGAVDFINAEPWTNKIEVAA